MKLEDVRKYSTVQKFTEILARDQLMLAVSPPKGTRGRWYVQLYDRATGEIGTGTSPNFENALILATASLERANVERTQEKSVGLIPDGGEIVAKEAS